MIVSVAVTGEVPVTSTDDGKVQVGALTAPATDDVSLQVRSTLPVKP